MTMSPFQGFYNAPLIAPVDSRFRGNDERGGNDERSGQTPAFIKPASRCLPAVRRW
ncbi:MAG: hypothetical protein ACR2P4_07125 [Gammaproteobacteria bacterium]